MRHALYALLPSEEKTDEALEAIRQLDVDAARVEVRVHDRAEARIPLIQDKLTLRETAGPGRLVRAGLVGALSGAALMLLIFWAIGSQAWGLAISLGVLFGGTLGPLMRGLAGTAVPDPKLQEWASRLDDGSVILTCRVDGLTLRERLAELFREHGALELHEQTL